ncbi:XrtV sorting system accessory protein [Sphingomonas sp.]|uniref:XrtV sorting system accessory protein n=1 Tax=Sphingomonas sp. TaxID=28214 RepID=UPI003CC6291A
MTVFDILTLALFGGLIVLFLERSIGNAPAHDPLWRYLVAASGCAATNYVGNQGYSMIAVVMLVATLAYIVYVLRPFDRLSQH